MFNFFKRSAAPPPKAAVKAGAKAAAKPPGQHSVSARNTAPPFHHEASLPEVVEGNEHSDWALWEDSANVLDSQMQGLTPSARIYERDKQTPSQHQDLDPFSRVGKKGG